MFFGHAPQRQHILRDPVKLHALIEEYGRLRRLQGFTEQSRGQRFNYFLMELLRCWGIEARASKRTVGRGETDVAFEFEGTRYILEAKWEEARQNKDPISKLQDLLNERVRGPVGIVLSMSGYTKEALDRWGRGVQPTVLLLDRDHLEAMLAGFIPPPEMIRRITDLGTFEGKGLVPVQSLYEGVEINDLSVDTNPSITDSDEALVIKSVSDFQAKVIATDLPLDQIGIAEYTKGNLLFTFPQGIYLFDPQKRKLSLFLQMPNCSGNVLVGKDGNVFMVRNQGVACFNQRRKSFSIIAGGFIGSTCLISGDERNIWAMCNVDTIPEQDNSLRPTITKLGESLGDEERHKIDCKPRRPACGVFVKSGRFLVIGNVVNSVGNWSNDFSVVELKGEAQPIWTGQGSKHPRALAQLSEERFIAASFGVEGLSTIDISRPDYWAITEMYGVELFEGSVSTYIPNFVAHLNLLGSVVILVGSANGSGYLLSNYRKNNQQEAGVLIRWDYRT
jgi:hypothetical protein